MATNTTTPVVALPEEDRKPSPLGAEWSDEKALAIVLQDFQKAEADRNANHDRRFVAADRLYTAYREKKYWEGTRVERASMGVFLTLSQIESLLPAFVDGLLGDPDFFAAYALGGTNPDQARAVQLLLRNQLRDLGDPGDFSSLRSIVLGQKKSDLQYGNGIIEWGWMMQQRQVERVQRRAIPRRIMLPGPDGVTMAPVNTGQYDISHERIVDNHLVSRPLVKNVDIRHFYIDPNTPSPNVQHAGFCATRHLWTIAELQAMRDDPAWANVRIPDDETLFELSKGKSNTQGDSAQQQGASYRGEQHNPAQDQSSDPNLATVEIIRYFQKSRTVWVMGRKRVALNEKNEYGLMPFLNSSYINVLGRFYSLSISDLTEGDQQLAQDILNARLDELSISVHPPTLVRTGARPPSSARRIKPGGWIELEDPSKDMVRMEIPPVNPQSFLEMNALEMRTQRATGVTDLSNIGVPSSGGNSANRTATGVATQRSAASMRIKFQVANYEDQVLAPLLYVVHAMNKRYLNPEQLIPLLGPQAQLIQLDPLAVINADVGFEILGATKMKARDALLGGGLQVIMETLANPALLTLLAQQGIKLNVMELVNLATDAFGLPTRSLFLPMSQEEMQAMNQPTPDQVLRMQMQEQRLTAQGQHQEQSDETKLMLGVGDMMTAVATERIKGETAKEVAAKRAAQKPKGDK